MNFNVAQYTLYHLILHAKNLQFNYLDMTQNEVTEFSISFSTYLSEVHKAGNTDAAECANIATQMVKHLIIKFPKIKQEMFFCGDGELLEDLGISRK